MNFFQEKVQVLRKNPDKWGWLLLVPILSIIWITTLNPNLSLIGWDNFSTSLDLRTNFFRTVFSTWREYRGLGVPSDSESVDLFRFLFFFILDVFLPNNLIDQVYLLGLYSLGLVGMYFLAREVLISVSSKFSKKSIVLSYLIAALIYGFNFHTVETFFLPVVMYPVRYTFFPLIILFFLRLINRRGNKGKNVLGFVIVNLFAATAYLTATLFITLGLLLLMMAPIAFSRMKRYLFWGTIIVLLNSFWLFPFVNYTVQKAAILPLASSFTSVNESLLNKPTLDFSWINLLTFNPLTLTAQALPFVDIANLESVTVVPALEGYESTQIQLLLLLPMILSVVGSCFLIYLSGKQKRLYNLWPVFVVVLTLFLLRKNLPPLGFLYTQIAETVPLFEVVFRFGGAKFFPLLLIGISVLSSLGVLLILRLMDKIMILKKLPVVSIGVVILLSIGIIYPFRSMISEGLFSSLVQVEVPSAYYQVADYINQQEEYGRVIHLPYDNFSYWRSHHWGYFGSTFLSFMLNKPTIDRTFEPASLENDFYLDTFLSEIKNISVVSDAESQARVKRLAQLLERTNTKFLIFDSSVSPEINEEGLIAWGVFNQNDFATALSLLEQSGEISFVNEYPITSNNLKQDTLRLYRLNKNRESSAFLSSVKNVDPELENAFIPPLLEIDENFIQSSRIAYTSYPFWSQQQVTESFPDRVEVSIPVNQAGSLQFQFPKQSVTHLYHDVFYQRADDQLVVYLQPRLLPVQGGFDLREAQHIQFDISGSENSLLVEVGGVMIPIEDNQSAVTFLGTVFVNKETVIRVLQNDGVIQVPLSVIQLTSDPNCYQDKKTGYDYSFTNTGQVVEVTTQNGMSCISFPLIWTPNDNEVEEQDFFYSLYVEAEQTTQQLSEDNYEIVGTQLEKEVFKAVNTLPLSQQLQYCLVDPVSGDCLHQEQFIRTVQKPATFHVWSTNPSREENIQVVLSLPAAQGYSSTLNINSIRAERYSALATAAYNHTITLPDKITLPAQSENKLDLIVPKVHSVSPEYANTSSFQTIGTCPADTQGLYSFRTDAELRTVGLINDCWMNMYQVFPTVEDLSYLWVGKYKLFWGRHPQLLAWQDEYEIKNQYVSRFNEYPEIAGFKSLQTGGMPWWSSQDYQQFIDKEIIKDDYFTESEIIHPISPERETFTNAQITQFAEGLGLVGVEELSLLPLPTYWRDLEVHTGQSEYSFLSGNVTSVERVLPSLWKINIGELEQGFADQQYLLEFGQAYDEQWEIYQTSSPVLAFLGIGKVSSHQVKVNGWSNGWITDQDNISSGDTVYVLYTPERLAWIGWGVTISTAGLLVYWSLRKRRQ